MIKAHLVSSRRSPVAAPVQTPVRINHIAERMVKNATQVEDKFLAHRENIKRKLEEVKEVAQLSDAENIKEAGEGVERLAQIFADLQNPIDRMETKLHYLQDGLDRERRLKILSGISSIPYKNHHNEACHNRMKGTGLWFLNDDKLSEWIRCSSSSILWLHGGPGTGKTKLV
jgi:Skp family chaperone for outer membrane proteins